MKIIKTFSFALIPSFLGTISENPQRLPISYHGLAIIFPEVYIFILYFEHGSGEEKAVFAQILAHLIEIFTRMKDLSLSLLLKQNTNMMKCYEKLNAFKYNLSL